MKFSLENFDDTALKVTNTQPNLLLHEIRATVKRLTEAQRPRAEGEEPASESAEIVKEELVSQLKKLVESPYSDLNPVPLQQTKDIFNGVASLLEDWRNILQSDRARRSAVSDQEFAKDHLVYILHGAAILSWQSPQYEQADNTNVLNDIIKETDDIRVLTYAFVIKTNVGGATQRVQGNKKSINHFLSDIFQKVSSVCMAQNLLRSPNEHFTILEIARGVNKDGQNILTSDFIFEVEKPAIGFNDKPQSEKIIVPRERILNIELSPSLIADKLISEYCKGVSDSSKLKTKLEAKIVWFRSLAIPEIAQRPMKYLIKLIQTAYQNRQYLPQEFNDLLKDTFYTQIKEFLSVETDKEQITSVLKSLSILYRGRGETTGFDPFLDIPRVPSDSNEEQQSWILNVLQEIASCRLDLESGNKVFKLNILKESYVKSTFFQWYFLRFFRNVLYSVSNKQHVLALETTQMIMALFKILRHDVPETQPVLEESEEMKTEQEPPVLTYHSRIINEATQILRTLARPRHEEQADMIANYENRLVFQMSHLKSKVLSASDGEDLNQEQDLNEKLDVCFNILSNLHELSQRDQTGVIARKIQESKILNQFLKLKEEDNTQILDSLAPRFFLLIGEICKNFPGVTPQLVRNGIVRFVFELANQRLPETDNSLTHFLFCMSQIMIHDEGKQAAAESGVLQSVIRQATDKLKFYELSPLQSNIFHARQYLKTIVERDPLCKDILKGLLEELIQKGIEYAKDLKEIYFKIASQHKIPIKDRKDEIQKVIKKSDQFKRLYLIQRMFFNFAGASENDFEGRHAADLRWTQGINTPDMFAKQLELHDLIGQNPSLSEISIKFAKSFKPLLEINTFPGNVEKLIDQWHSKFLQLETLLGGKKMSKVETLPLDFKEEDEKMDGSESTFTAFISIFHSFLVHSVTFQTMHSASIALVGQKDKVKELIEGVMDLYSLICKSNCASKVKEIQDFICTPKEDEKEELDRKELMMTRQEYIEMPFAGAGREEIVLNISKKFERSTLSYLSSKIPAFSEQMLALRELLQKLAFVQLQNQRPGRDNNQNREISEKTQKFMGTLTLKTVKQLVRQSLKIGNITNSPQTCYHLLMIINILDNMSNLAAKGWFSSISFFEFYVAGGLKLLLDFYNWVCQQVQDIKADNILASNWSHLEIIANRTSNFILKYIIEDEKSVRDSRLSDMFLQTLFQFKMEPHFENTKQYIQNVCHTLCSELLIGKINNPLLLSEDKQIFNQLTEVPMVILSCASKQFQNCPTLKVGFGNSHRNYDMRGDDRRGGGRPGAHAPPNPMHVQQILDLGFVQYPREQIIQALQQNRDDVNRAIDYLLTQPPAFDPFAQILNQIDRQNASTQNIPIIEDEEDVDILLSQALQESSLLEDAQNQAMPQKIEIKLQKPVKVSESEVQEVFKNILKKGFDWLTEAFDTLPDTTRSQNVLFEIMKNWKTELTGDDQVKQMKALFSKIDEILKIKLINKVAEELEKVQKAAGQDVIMSEEVKEKEKHSDACIILYKTAQFLKLVQKLITCQKAYLKEALACDIPFLCQKQINILVDLNNKCSTFKDIESSVSKCLQNLIHSFLFTLFTIVHMQQGSLTLNLLDFQRRNQLTPDYIKKLKSKFALKLPHQQLFYLCNQLIDHCLEGTLKTQIMTTSFNLAFRLILEKNEVTQEYRDGYIRGLFSKLNEVLNGDKLKAIDHTIINSISILFFETDSVVQPQIEKFIQRVLYTKYEFQTEGDKKDQNKEAAPHILTKVNFNNFLSFFKQLSVKSPESFKKLVGDFCDLKTVKVVGGKASQDKTEIMLKESLFNEVKKTVLKERGTFKLALKVIDYQDKGIKAQIHAAKKGLSAQISEEVKFFFQNFITNMSSSSKHQIEDLDNFVQGQIAGTPTLVSKDKLADIFAGSNQTQILEMLAKLCQAYPAYTSIMMPQKSSVQTANAKKSNFIQWYIKEFLVSQMLLRVTKAVNQGSEEQKDESKDMYEVSYVMKPVETLKLLEDHVARFLNRLTSFNHMMTLNEQLVKYQLRSKFLIEALSIIQKKLKEKGSAKSSIKQKALMLASLSIVEALINPAVLSVKILNIGQDNFQNSLRLCVVRDSSATNSEIPVSLIKLLDELLTDYADVSLPQNSDIVTKSVKLLKIMSEFISTEKKKEEDGKVDEEIKQMEIVGDQIMPLDEPVQEESDHDEDQEAVDDEEDDLEEDQNAHQIEAEMLDEEEDEDGDDGNEDDEEEHLPEDDEDDDNPDHIHNVEVMDDDYDEEAPDDDDDDDDPHGAALIIREGGRRAGPANDIINLNPNQPQRVNRHEYMLGWRHPGRAERIGVAGQVDWSQEEQEVQRILGNFRSNNPDIIAPPAAPEDRMFHDHRHRPQNQEDLAPKKGLIDLTFEDLKIITDQEIYTQVVNSQNSLDREIALIQSQFMPVTALNNNPPNPRVIGGPAGALERQMGIPHIFGRPHIVDELDEEDFGGARFMPPMDGLFEGNNRILDLLQNEHDILNRLLMNEGLLPPRIGGPVGVGAAWGDPLGYHPPPRRPGAPEAALAQQEGGHFLNQIRQTIQASNQNQAAAALEQMQQQIMQTAHVQVEEEKRVEQQPLQQPPPISNAGSGQRSIDNMFRQVYGQSIYDHIDAPVQVNDQQLLQNFFQPLNVNPASRQSERASSPTLIRQEQISAQIIPEQVQEPIQAPEVIILGQIQMQQQDNQNPIIPDEGVAQLAEQLNQVQIPSEQQLDAQIPLVANQLAEEIKVQENPNEEIKQEEVKQEPIVQNEAALPNTTFGYDNDLLLAYDIDPSILIELPEEVRAEFLLSVGLPPINQQQQQLQQVQQQPPQIQAQPQPAANQAAQEEQKQEVQPQPASEAQQPEYYAIARELGLDPEFLANLPEDMRTELIQQAQLERAPPRRQAEQMDVASFLATVTDVSLRREIFMNMDEATVNSLPPQLMAEARRVQEYIRNDRQRIRDQFQERIRNPLGNEEDDNLFGGGAGIFGGRRRREEMERLARQQAARQNQERLIEEVVNIRMKEIADETPKDDIIAAINTQLVQDEKIIEAFLQILLTNEKIQCDLIPCLQFLLKIQNSNGVPVIRNKVVNVITFVLKNLAVGNDQALSDLGIKAAEIKKKQSILILIGTLRLLLKTNKSLMKYILKGLISKEDSQAKGPGTQMLRKQLKAIGYKQPIVEEATLITDIIDTSSGKKTSKDRPFNVPSPLAEIFSLIKVDLFKQEKMLMRNLTLLIHQILKNFDIARQELEQSQQQISQETISTIAEVLSLENIDQQMMEDLGDFLFKISKQKKSNFTLISDYCLKKSSTLLDKLSSKLNEFSIAFDQIKSNISPSKKLGLNSREMSSISNNEEEKGEMMINTSSFAISQALARSSSLAPTQSKAHLIKLDDEDEKHLRQLLKVYDDSEVLYRIFKLFNLFYDKFSTDKPSEEAMLIVENQAQSNVEDVLNFVKSTYENDDLKIFVSSVSDVLKIVFKTGMEPNEGISNLIFCVLSSFYPELFESIKKEEEQKTKEKKELEEKKGDKAKFQVKMIPVQESGAGHISKEKFTLFRNTYYITNRIEELSNFCMVNKRIINKMIKQKPNLFVNELEGLIRHMPNLLDFDNKRTYFKKELGKFKRNNLYGDQIQLYIRRDDIFQDSFTQIRDKTANEMKGRLHISFTGERGQDAGGLTRDFFIELSREMFNPNYSLFILSSSGSTYYPNPKSHVEVQHLSYFKFIGRMVGKAIFDECLLECYFVKSLYKIMTGEPLCFSDLEDFDNEFYNNMKWCLENDVECLMTTFVAETDYFGKPLEVELIPNGKNITVTNNNKREYVEKLCYFKLYSEIQKQVDNFLEGFYELIPKDLVSVFNYKELELLISGLPNFDINDLKANTEFSGYNSSSQQVLWLWEVLETFDCSERAEFLQFVTGSSKVPLDGFKGLIGMRGPQKFTIAKIKSDDFMRLPSGHTCFNQIDLPEYPSKEILHERLLLAIKETKGFGFA